jgi:hypothetical protein
MLGGACAIGAAAVLLILALSSNSNETGNDRLNAPTATATADAPQLTESEVLDAVSDERAIGLSKTSCDVIIGGPWELEAEYASDGVWTVSDSCDGRVNVLGRFAESSATIEASPIDQP